MMPSENNRARKTQIPDHYDCISFYCCSINNCTGDTQFLVPTSTVIMQKFAPMRKSKNIIVASTPYQKRSTV